MIVSIDDYKEVKECIYKDEHYSVRDNGAIMRHRREGKAKRKYDEVWAFGIPNPHTGYMLFCGERVHRIVATAFHGPAPTPGHVVDHIDTNRQNNRPENLRYLTKLENALNNPVTRKKIELICGSIEAFLVNPQLLWGFETDDVNFKWMKSVTKEEAQNCLDNWNNWARTVAPDPKYNKAEHHVGEWIYYKPKLSPDVRSVSPANVGTTDVFVNPFINKIPSKSGYKSMEEYHAPLDPPNSDYIEDEVDDTKESLTQSARQRYWRTPTFFPFCPEEVTEDGLFVYLNNLKVGGIFSKNDRYDPYYVVDKGMGEGGKSLVVLSTNRKNDYLSWALTTITIENNKFVHENTEAKAGKELSERYFKFLIGQGELSDDDFYMLEALE